MHFTIWSVLRDLANIAITAVVLLAFLGRADRHRRAEVLPDGRLRFSPNRRASIASLLIVGYFAYLASEQWMHLHGKLDLVTALGLTSIFAMFLMEIPGTILVGHEGIEQVLWVGTNRRILWTDIVEINTGEKERTVTIKSKSGTKIIHSRQLPDRPRLLWELKQHCGAELPPDFPREPITAPDPAGQL